MYPGVELRLYRYVSVLAEELNFTRAALRLHVTQPTLSAQVRTLENDLGIRLFDRDKGAQRMKMTSAGEAFAEEARLTLFHAGRAVDSARTAAGQHKGPWTLGYSPLLNLQIPSKIRHHLSQAHPGADIRLASAHTSEQADCLMRGRLQAGLVILPFTENGLTCEGLYRQGLVLALPDAHPLTSKRAVEITDLNEIPVVVIRRDIEPHFEHVLKRVFALTRISLHIFHEATTQAEALELVSEGACVALMMPSAQYPQWEGIVFKKFADELLSAETGLAYLGENGSPLLATLREFLLSTFQPFSGHLEDTKRQMALF